MDAFIRDVQYALRAFTRAPGFTCAALVTMATAIGANATVFSFVNALLVKPPAGVRSPATLVSVFTSDFSSGRFGSSSYPDFETIRASGGAFSGLAAFRETPPTLLRVGDATERVRTMSVSGDYFSVLGVPPVAGRLIMPADIVTPGEPSVVLGEAFWHRAFRSNPSLVGTSVSVNGVPHTVIGILPAAFTGLNLGAAYDLWVALPPRLDEAARSSRNISVVGRLASGSSLEKAQAQLDTIVARLAAEFPATNRGILGAPDQPRPFRVTPLTRLHPNFRRQVGMISAVLVSAAGLVLLIACANVAALLLSRATARSREMALRLALGANRPRLFRQLLTESLLLGLAGGVLGLIVSLWTSEALPSFFPAEQARLLDAGVDGRVLAFTALVAVLSGVIFGAAPALQGLRTTPSATLRAGGDRAGDSRPGMLSRRLLVVGQVALASVLLVSTVLLVRSLSNATVADLGYTTKEAALVDIEVPRSMDEDASRSYYGSVIETTRALPGVESAALAQFVPVAGTSRRGYRLDGYTPREGEDVEQYFNVVSHEYFETMGIAPVAGRLFTDADRSGRRVAIVNQTFADRYFDRDGIGRRIIDPRGGQFEIVGIVRADRRLDLQDAPAPVIFLLLDQHVIPRVTLVAKTAGDAGALVETVRRSAAAINRDAAVFRAITFEAHLDEALAANRLTVGLVATCSLMALALALVGVYGVVTFAVARRTREIGVRVALGATPWQVLRLLLADHGVIVGSGLLLGLGGALVVTRLLGSMLYAVSPTDIPTFALVFAAVGAMAALACILPASRALRLDPVAALRQE